MLVRPMQMSIHQELSSKNKAKVSWSDLQLDSPNHSDKGQTPESTGQQVMHLDVLNAQEMDLVFIYE